jgi:Rrf2 family nitric oxide-sensitive transcriptional repressor
LAAPPRGRATIAEIAKSYGISQNHLVKVVHFLGRTGFLANERGRGGGVRLAGPPAGISVGAVVRMAEGAAVPAVCFDANAEKCCIAPACRLRNVLGEAVQSFYAVLDRCMLDDLVANANKLQPLLFAPRAGHGNARAPTRSQRWS